MEKKDVYIGRLKDLDMGICGIFKLIVFDLFNKIQDYLLKVVRRGEKEKCKVVFDEKGRVSVVEKCSESVREGWKFV